MHIVSNKRGAQLAAQCVPFRNHGNTFKGDWSEDSRCYKVWSYDVVIAEYRMNHWKTNDDKYSPTTSRHQNLLRQELEKK